ncbi:MAG: hypothetical protein GY940_18735 [bacterium]|nr:hypothetical protein [bacterium]
MNLKLTRKFLAAIVLLLVVFTPYAISQEKAKPSAYDPAKTYTAKQLKEDLSLLRSALEEAHGGLYRYTSKKELDRLFETVSVQLNQPMTERGFYAKLLPLVAAINDGHTGLALSTPYDNYLETNPVLFPFNLRFVKWRAYLFRNYSEKPGIPMGGELIAINGHSVPQMLTRFMPLISSDAHIETSKISKLQGSLFFGKLFMSIYGESKSFTIAYRPPGKTTIETLKVTGASVKNILDLFSQRYPKVNKTSRERLPISLEYKEGIPVLTILGFGGGAYTRNNISYPDFLAKSFRELNEKKSKHLIIDLRNNSGGSDEYGKMLAAYFIDKPFNYYKALEIKTNNLSFLKHTNIPPQRNDDLKNRAKPNARGWYDMTGHPNLGIQQPLKPTFTGKVWILINGSSFSATGETTSVIHSHKRAVFVGEECGAGYYGNTSGFSVTLTLPNTAIKLRIPLVRYTMAVSGYAKDRGLVPDHLVSPAIKDLMEEKDVQMEFVIHQIKKSK